MLKASKPAFYAVAKGRVPGVYGTNVSNRSLGSPGTSTRNSQHLNKQGITSHSTKSPAATPRHLASSSTIPAPPSSRKAHGPKPYERPTPANEKAQEKGCSFNSSWTALSTEMIGDESEWDVVYSDGVCKGNGKIGSIAGVGLCGEGTSQETSRNDVCPGVQTNNRAELIVHTPVYLLHVLC